MAKKIERNKTQRYSVSLTPENYKMLMEIDKKLGSVSVSETWRQLITRVHGEMFKPNQK